MNQKTGCLGNQQVKSCLSIQFLLRDFYKYIFLLVKVVAYDLSYFANFEQVNFFSGYFADFEQVKFLSGYFAGFEQVKIFRGYFTDFEQ